VSKSVLGEEISLCSSLRTLSGRNGGGGYFPRKYNGMKGMRGANYFSKGKLPSQKTSCRGISGGTKLQILESFRMENRKRLAMEERVSRHLGNR